MDFAVTFATQLLSGGTAMVLLQSRSD